MVPQNVKSRRSQANAKCYYLQKIVLCLTWLVAVLILVVLFGKNSTQTLARRPSWVDPSIQTRSVNVTHNNTNAIALQQKQHAYNYGTSGIICGALILVFMYILITFDIVHRTVASILASTLSIGVMGALGDRPTIEMISLSLDAETLLQMFSMMLFVALMAPTGIFDYTAVFAFRLTRGRTWHLIIMMSLFTIYTSAFLDNVTTILFSGAVTIRVCEIAELAPQPVMMMIIFSTNFGGMSTAIGDPPNMMMINSQYFTEQGVKFFNFTCHMSLGTFIVSIFTFLQLRFINFRGLQKFEVAAFNKKKGMLAKKQDYAKMDKAQFQAKLKELYELYPIHDKLLMLKSVIVLVFVFGMFLLKSTDQSHSMSYSFVALFGVLLLIILADEVDEFPKYLNEVDWSILLFFATMFVLMDCLGKLGLIQFLGDRLMDAIIASPKRYHMSVTILSILYLSGFGSAFLDNTPLMAMMHKIVENMHMRLEYPIFTLIIPLAFGLGLGGNGSILGSAANIIGVRLAEKAGYPISFKFFFIIGFPVMVVSLLVASVYLIVTHVILHWNY